jgi:Protein of unknown function (DUF2794)
LTGIGQHYDSINESVMIAGHYVAVARARGGNSHSLLPILASGAIIAVTDMSHGRRRRMSYGDTEPSEFHGGEARGALPLAPVNRVTFDRRELNRIFGLYGRKVAAGEWRDYAIDFLKDRAVFSVFRRAAEVPVYRIEKSPKLARRQGAYSVISATGLIVRRGHELDPVLRAIDQSLSVVAG